MDRTFLIAKKRFLVPRDKFFFGYPGPSTSEDEITYIYDAIVNRWLKSGSVGSRDFSGSP